MYQAACLEAGETEAKRGEAEGRRGRSRGVGSDFASPEPTSRTRATDVGEELRDGASRSPRHCAPPPAPRSYARRGMGSDAHETTKRSRPCCGVAVGTNMETPRAGEEAARCAIVAELSQELRRGSGAGRRNLNRSRRARLASRHVGGAASVISPAHWAARTGNRPMGAKLLDAAPFRARRLRQFLGGIFPVGRSAEASRRASGATLPRRQARLSLRSAALDLPSDRTTDRGGAASVMFLAHWAA